MTPVVYFFDFETAERRIGSTMPNAQNLKKGSPFLLACMGAIRGIEPRPTLMSPQAIEDGERFMAACRKIDAR